MTPEVAFDGWSVFFLLASAQGFFLCFVFYLKRNSNPEILLNLIVLLFSITLVEYVAFWTNYRFEFPHINRVSSAFPFLFGPLFYLYIRSYLSERNLSKKDLVHIIPFALNLAMLIPYYLLSAETKLSMLFNRQIFLFKDEVQLNIFSTLNLLLPIFMVFHLMMYSYLGFRLIRKKDFKKVHGTVERWLSVLIYCFIGFVVGFVSYYIMVYVFSYNLIYDYAISVAMSLFIYTIGYYGFISPEVLEGNIGVHTEKEKYQNSGLSKEGAKKLKDQLISLMEEEKVFLQNDLKLQDLAKAVDESKHHVSQVINDELETTFSAFVNEYRIKESQKLLVSRPDELNMYGIAKESGFNNKTTFSLAFKRHTGMTPSLYQKKFLDSK